MVIDFSTIFWTIIWTVLSMIYLVLFMFEIVDLVHSYSNYKDTNDVNDWWSECWTFFRLCFIFWFFILTTGNLIKTLFF